MRKLFFTLLGGLLILGMSYAQETEYFKEAKKTKRELRKEKRAEKRKVRSEKQSVGVEMLKSRDFVLLAKTINGPSGFTVPVRETTNFVKVDSSKVTVQYGEPGKSGGENGLGGVTFQGIIKGFEVNEPDEGENKTTNFVIYFTSPLSANVMSVHIHIWGDKAQARFFNGDRNVTFDGKYAKASETKLWESGVRKTN